MAGPTLQLHLDATCVDDDCPIADAIRQQHPNLTNVIVDLATIHVTDRVSGERRIYFTPPAAQHVLLSFDQGWPNPIDDSITLEIACVCTLPNDPKGN